MRTVAITCITILVCCIGCNQQKNTDDISLIYANQKGFKTDQTAYNKQFVSRLDEQGQSIHQQGQSIHQLQAQITMPRAGPPSRYYTFRHNGLDCWTRDNPVLILESQAHLATRALKETNAELDRLRQNMNCVQEVNGEAEPTPTPHPAEPESPPANLPGHPPRTTSDDS